MLLRSLINIWYPLGRVPWLISPFPCSWPCYVCLVVHGDKRLGLKGPGCRCYKWQWPDMGPSEESSAGTSLSLDGVRDARNTRPDRESLEPEENPWERQRLLLLVGRRSERPLVSQARQGTGRGCWTQAKDPRKKWWRLATSCEEEKGRQPEMLRQCLIIEPFEFFQFV